MKDEQIREFIKKLRNGYARVQPASEEIFMQHYADGEEGVLRKLEALLPPEPKPETAEAKYNRCMDQRNPLLESIPWKIDIGMNNTSLSIQRGGKEVFRIVNIGKQ